MAEAPGHRLGQIVGESLEKALEPILQAVAEQHSLYLDKAGDRLARGRRKKVTWTDALGNSHDLDYVLERDGSATKIGVPAAFIETAWRRYTKHSKNKAQEIQGAVLPLLETHSRSKPFAGAVLAGVFTKGSLDQLRSNGFAVLYIPYEEVIAAFARFGIDLAYDEATPDEHLAAQIDRYDSLSEQEREAIGNALRETAPEEFRKFGEALDGVLSRRVRSVTVVPLHGQSVECESVQDAILFVRSYPRADAGGELAFIRFEVVVRYSTGDRITAEFGRAEDAGDFLETFL